MSLKNTKWFSVSIVIIILDQITKYLATYYLQPYQPLPILPFFNLTLAFNTGAAFSFLNTSGEWHQWFFGLFSFSMSVLIIIWILNMNRSACVQLTGLSLILGGALGNLIDRIHLGNVVDFIELYYKSYHWPVFNIADSAICIGATLLFLDLGFSRIPSPHGQ